MYYLFVCMCVVASLATVYGAVEVYPQEEKPAEFANQEGCYLSKLNKVLPYQQPYSPQDGVSCEQYMCEEDHTTRAFTCGSMAVPEDCETSSDLTLPYPDCCKKLECEKN